MQQTATRAPRPQQADGQIVTARELSRLSGVSMATIASLSKQQMIPRPVEYDHNMPLYDLADEKLAAWLKALQAVGYNRR